MKSYNKKLFTAHSSRCVDFYYPLQFELSLQVKGGPGSQILVGPDRQKIIDWPGGQINDLL